MFNIYAVNTFREKRTGEESMKGRRVQEEKKFKSDTRSVFSGSERGVGEYNYRDL